MQKRGLGSEVKRQNIRTLSLVVCTFTYLLVGAAIFDALESETERKRWEYLSHMKRLMVEKYNITQEDYRMIELVVTENKPNKSGPQWKFAGAFYFATVVLAMIGYGHSTPVTPGGRAFCIVYATIGIPLGLVMFQSIGERLNKFASVVIKKAKTLLRCKKVEATQMNLMFATGLLSSIIITSGAGVFSRYEGWTYFDSFYYCFVTLTTIGFGDYVALQNDHALTEKPGYVALSLVFILFGLAVVAASINLLVLRFMTMNTGDILREETETFPMNGQNVRSFEEEYLPQWSSAMYRDQFVDSSSPCSSQTYTNQYICSTQHPNIYTSYPDLPVSRPYLRRTNYQLPSCACGKCSLQTKKLRNDEQINFKHFYGSKNDRIIV